MITPIRAVSFDLDGTLYDASRMRRALLWATFPNWRALRVGQRVREELRARSFVDGAAFRDEEARICAERLDVTPVAARALLDDLFDARLVRVLRRTGPVPGARALVEQLVAQGVAIAVISDRGAVREKLDALGLLDGIAWGALLSADELGALKPDARPFTTCAARLGVSVDALLHIGDRADSDAAGAQAAGARALLVGPTAPLSRVRIDVQSGRVDVAM